MRISIEKQLYFINRGVFYGEMPMVSTHSPNQTFYEIHYCIFYMIDKPGITMDKLILKYYY